MQKRRRSSQETKGSGSPQGIRIAVHLRVLLREPRPAGGGQSLQAELEHDDPSPAGTRRPMPQIPGPPRCYLPPPTDPRKVTKSHPAANSALKRLPPNAFHPQVQGLEHEPPSPCLALPKPFSAPHCASDTQTSIQEQDRG